MDIVIIGGGAAGMCAAIWAAKTNRNNKITVLEHGERVGKKILATGNGKCNLTNLTMNEECYRCDDINIVKEVLLQFNEKDTLKMFEELGVLLKNRDGYVYPYSNQAATILDALRNALEYMNINIMYEAFVNDIKPNKKSGYDIIMRDKKIRADRVIIATGSCASNIKDADESGYKLVKKLGYKLYKPLPALTSLKSNNKLCKLMSGVRSDGKVELYVDNKLVAYDEGEVQLTEYGISGIPVFQVSRYASRALYEGKRVKAIVDLMPCLDKREITDFLKSALINCKDKSLLNHMYGIVNKKVADAIVKAARLDDVKNCAMREADISKLVDKIKAFEFEIVEASGFDKAQICTGGILLDQINEKTMESKLHKGIYFAGEILDVDGICGGYNLQWAWSTGYIAGRNAAC